MVLLTLVSLAVIAGLFVARDYLRDDAPRGESAPALVATGHIPAGMSWETIEERGLVGSGPRRNVAVETAVGLDPYYLRGLVAIRDIHPGEQILGSAFGPP